MQCRPDPLDIGHQAGRTHPHHVWHRSYPENKKCSLQEEHVLLVICLLLHKHRRAANQTIHGHSDQVHTGWPVVSCDHMLLCTNARLFLPDQLSAIVKNLQQISDCQVFSALTIRPDPAATGLGKDHPAIRFQISQVIGQGFSTGRKVRYSV